MKDLKVIFMGTPEFSVPVLEGLIENYNVLMVVTQPDKKVDRKQEVVFSKVKEKALENKIKVFQPIKIRDDYQEILSLNPDLIVTCAYGQIIPKVLLDCPKYGCVNVHASLLPKLRGGAPIHHAIIDGYGKTGITIMYMDEKMDNGDILAQEELIINDSDNVGTLHDKLSLIGKELLIKSIPDIVNGLITPVKQDINQVTFAYNITREDELIDFNKNARAVFNQIRGLNPFPGGYALLDGKIVKIYSSRLTNNLYTEKKNGEIVRVYDDGIGVSTNDFEIIITEIKFEGKRKMFVKDYLNGIKKEELIGKVFNKG